MSEHLRQTNFAAGELSPLMYGRSDSELFGRGLHTMKNFFINHQGMAMSRPGTKYCGQAKTSGHYIRLVPFVYSDSASFCLEIGSGYIRFWRSGARVTGPTNELTSGGSQILNGVSSITPTLYDANDIQVLQWSQIGAVLTITCPGKPAYELRLDGVGNFSINPIDYDLKQIKWVNDSGPNNKGPAALVSSGTTTLTNIFIGDADHPLREWQYKVTASAKNNITGAVFETRAFDVYQNYNGVSDATANSVSMITGVPGANLIRISSDRPVTLRKLDGSVLPPSWSLGWTIISYNYYRGRGSLFGFVGSTLAVEFVDFGEPPGYDRPPPFGDVPIAQSCAASTIFEGRRVLAGFATDPGTLNISASKQFENFDRLPLQQSALSALFYDLNSRKRERIRTLVALSKLLIFTDTSVWTFSGGQASLGSSIVPESRVIDEVGSISLMPLVIRHTALFVRSKGRGVRALMPTQYGSWEPKDISTHAQHLFIGGENGISPDGVRLPTRQITDWTYAEDPWGVVWAVRDDGVLLSMTLSDDVAGWSRHETNGDVLAVCSIPETSEDAVYLAVRRYINGSSKVVIERMTSRVRNDNHITDDICLDCTFSYIGPPPVSGGVTGLGHLEGSQVYAIVYGDIPIGPLTVSGGSVNIGYSPAADADGNVAIHVGLKYECDIKTLPIVKTGIQFREKSVKSVGFEVDSARGIRSGTRFDTLEEWPHREVSDAFSAPSIASAIVRVDVTDDWNKFGYACIRQSLPLPVTVLGITREFDIGGE